MSAVAAPTTLSPRDQMIAYMEAAGMPPREVSQRVGLSYQRVYVIRQTADYQTFLTDLKREIREKVVDNASKLVETFNEEAMPAFETLQKLHKDAENENVRLGAANSILDRAPDAPKVNKNTGTVDARTILQLPVRTIEGMNQALTEVGEAEIVELYEEAGRWQAPEDSMQLISLEELEEQGARN